MALEINQPSGPKKTFILNRALHATKDGAVVEEDDPLGVKVIGGKGKAFFEEEAKALGLNESHREGGQLAAAAPTPVEEPVAPEPEIAEPVIEAPEPADEPSEPAPKKAKK